MFPPDQLAEMVRLTNKKLRAANRRETTRGEILKFFGIVVLCTCFEFQSRENLWSTTAPSKYRPAACFDRTGMSSDQFDNIPRYIRFSDQPDERPEGMQAEEYR